MLKWAGCGWWASLPTPLVSNGSGYDKKQTEEFAMVNHIILDRVFQWAKTQYRITADILQSVHDGMM